MELQELLDKYKDRIFPGYSCAILFDKNTNIINYIYYQEDGERKYVEKSLLELLFNTPFLSLLDFESVDVDIVEYQDDDDGVQRPNVKTLTTLERHKINLVLLPDDRSRVEYIEQFTS